MTAVKHCDRLLQMGATRLLPDGSVETTLIVQQHLDPSFVEVSGRPTSSTAIAALPRYDGRSIRAPRVGASLDRNTWHARRDRRSPHVGNGALRPEIDCSAMT